MATPAVTVDEAEFSAAAQNAVGDHATADDSLGFAPYVEAIAAFLTSEATEPPLTISIEGEWGSGKSSFMLQLQKAIAGPSARAVFMKELPTRFGGFGNPGSVWKAIRAARSQRRPRPTIRFNAWRHDKQDALWAAFALSVARRLRKRIGFVSAWRGDLYLFFLRLTGMRGWLELLLLLVSVVILLVSASVLYHHFLPLGLAHALHSLANIVTQKKAPDLEGLYASLLTKDSAQHSSWGALFLLAIAGFVKFHQQLKLPISIDLKKYLATPDYNGHAAFIESFHEDFTRLIRAYAGNERVFIFIDDLDRCDVPRAAELMQAINLMISDAGRLIFILGMDREKVAAGITQKYKDLLPFLPEYATGIAPSVLTGAGASPLSFGYSYLEKFIQLSFTLPVIAKRDALEKFLDSMLPKGPALTWKRQMTYYWTPKLARRPRLSGVWRHYFGSPIEPSVPTLDEPAPPKSTGSPSSPSAASAAEAIHTEEKIRNLRIKMAEDSKGVRSIVYMVSTLFENNPRRLKQFISTYRLALFLASGQGGLNLDPAKSGVTPQQLGKFVALTMKFPDLRVALVDNPNLLGDLQSGAGSWPVNALPEQAYWRWLHRSTVRTLLRFGVQDAPPATKDGAPVSPEPANAFSLQGLDVTRLMSLLPKVAPPPEPTVLPSEPGATTTSYRVDPLIRRAFTILAEQYEQIRATQPSGPQRTRALTAVVDRVRKQAMKFGPGTIAAILSAQLSQNSEGSRIVALGIACERILPENLSWLLDFLAEFRTSFEHYWTIQTLFRHQSYFTARIAKTVSDTLDGLQPRLGLNPDWVPEARQLRALARSMFDTSAESSPPSAAPPASPQSEPVSSEFSQSDIASEQPEQSQFQSSDPSIDPDRSISSSQSTRPAQQAGDADRSETPPNSFYDESNEPNFDYDSNISASALFRANATPAMLDIYNQLPPDQQRAMEIQAVQNHLDTVNQTATDFDEWNKEKLEATARNIA